ncbi:hypothetical protein BRADI_3g10266v3 [Brachypodium distachyon]|uniref:Uncharacterized protein n=1 Tax=Brachypodium distachyon TaxID=15368 RepID=A0A2K2CWD1_BRADI|nr:hypothetical protein BRADI_3g10266v3 [Brachypodium distachyon]
MSHDDHYLQLAASRRACMHALPGSSSNNVGNCARRGRVGRAGPGRATVPIQFVEICRCMQPCVNVYRFMEMEIKVTVDLRNVK